MAQVGESGTLGGSNKLPLLDKLNGKMERWEEWSWLLGTYVALLIAKASDMMSMRISLPRAALDISLLTKVPDIIVNGRF